MSSIRDEIIRVFGPCISEKVTDSYVSTTLAGIPFAYTKHRQVWEGIIRFIEQLKIDQDRVVRDFVSFKYQLAPSTLFVPVSTKEMQKYIHLYGYHLVTGSTADIGEVSLAGCHACAWSDRVKCKIFDDLLPANDSDKCLCPLDFTIPIGLMSPSGRVYHCLGGLYDPIYSTLIHPFTKVYNRVVPSFSTIEETGGIPEEDLIVSLNLAREIYSLKVREGVIPV